MSIDWKSRTHQAFASAGERAIDDDIVEELASHAQAAYQTARSNNCTHDEGVHHVDELISRWVKDAPQMKRRPRRTPPAEPPSETAALLPGIVQEIRYALRLLRKQPGHAAAVILIMTLGIGATTTLFSVAYGVLLKPLPWPQADRLVRLQETRPGATRVRAWTITNASFLAWREHHSTVDEIAGWNGRSATLTGTGTATSLSFVAVTSNLFSMLGANPIQGSLFHPEDEIAAPNVVVLSYGLWQQQFGGAPDAVGKTVRLDEKPYTVIGIMSPTFAFPDRDSRAWIPLYVVPPVSIDGLKRSVQLVNAIARLHSGATPAEAAAEATTSARAAPDLGMSAIAMFGANTPPQVTAMPALDAMTAEVRPAIIVFLVAVGLLLVTATANVASLQLARSTARSREMAIRAAIGASKIRLTRQLITESLLLGAIGGITGLALVAALHAALPSLLPANFPRMADIGLNLPVVIFAAAITVLTAVTCGVWPALHLGAVNVAESLTEHGAERMSSGRKTQRTRAVVMTGQIAIACVLLSGATLLAKSFWRMLHADRGYDTLNLITANVTMRPATFTPARRAVIVNNVLARLAVMPGVVHAAVTDSMQFTGETMAMTSFQIPGTTDRPTIIVSTLTHVVSLQYFPTMGIRLLEGRPFMETDKANSPPVVLVNRTFQQRYLKDKTLGAMLPCATAESKECEVIGVVDDVHRNYDDAFEAERFLLDQQWTPPPYVGLYVTFIARTTADPNPIINELKSLIHDEDSSLTVDSILSMEDRVAGSLAKPRLYAVLLGGFAAFALMIAATGLFGVLSYTVAQRSMELALRVALGARHADIVKLVAAQALWITFGGLIAGTGLTIVSVNYLSSFLYGVTTRDTFTFIAVPLIVTLVATTACLLPAIRAIRINPLEAMRSE